MSDPFWDLQPFIILFTDLTIALTIRTAYQLGVRHHARYARHAR